jgi:hypothetical protein
MLIFMLKARKPAIYREPRAAALALSTEDLRAIEDKRRLRELSSEQLEAELAELARRRQLADEARAKIPRRASGAPGQ